MLTHTQNCPRTLGGGLAMSFSKGFRSNPRRKPQPADVKRPSDHPDYEVSAGKKTRSIQSLQERLSFTTKRPRTSRAKGLPKRLAVKGVALAGGVKHAKSSDFHSRSSRSSGSSTLMESGLIQIPHLQYCDYYESPSSLLTSSAMSPESVANSASSITSAAATTSSTSTSTSASSSVTRLSSSHSPTSPLEYTSSDDSFACDEVLSLVSSCCPDMVIPNVLDFMTRSDFCEQRCMSVTTDQPVSGVCGSIVPAILPDQTARSEHSGSVVEDDGEPYNIDLRDFEPDVNSLSSPLQDGANNQRNNGGGVLCLRLDHEEVLRAWKERQECLISREPIYYPSPYLDPFHVFGHPPLIPHPPFF